jgi:hypothetical protein
MTLLQGDGAREWRMRTENLYKGQPATCSGINKTLTVVNSMELLDLLKTELSTTGRIFSDAGTRRVS